MRHQHVLLSVLSFALLLIPSPGVTQERGQKITDLSLDSLLHIEISTAAKYEQSTSDAPASVTIITSEDIRRYGYQTLEDVLNQVRGFYVSNDRNYSYLGVRGFSRPTDYNDRILLLLNGHTLNENFYGQAFIGTELGLDLGAIERIEIVRGPGSALYGANAMFAVINLITKKGNTVDGLNLAAETGSYGRQSGAALFGKELNNGLDILISGLWGDIKGQNLYFKEFDDPSTNNGIAENLDWDKYYGILTTIRCRDFTAEGMMTSRKKGVPTASWEMSFNDDAAKTLDDRSFIQLQYDHRVSRDKSIMLRSFYDHYNFKGWYPANTFTWDSNDGNWMGTEFKLQWDLRTDDRLTFGSEYQNHLRADYRYWSRDVTYFNKNFPYNIFSLYLQNEFQAAENLSLVLGIRRDENSTTTGFTAPRGAIIYNPIKTGTLKLLYGQAYRAPNIYEVDFEDSASGYKSNPALKPEKIVTAEVGWEQRISSEIYGTMSLYDYRMTNLIDQTIDPSDSMFQFQNLKRVKAYGLGLELNAHLKTGFCGYAIYNYQNAEDAETKEELTNSPRHIFKVGLSSPLMKHFYASAQWLYETERITVYGTKTDPYLLTNVNISSKLLFNHVRASFLVKNLFDVEYKLPGGYEHKEDAITQNGRNFIIRLEYKL
ncbi:MAG: TonB-dependent receptor [Candidatus Zixiibacteriota bacterium]